MKYVIAIVEDYQIARGSHAAIAVPPHEESYFALYSAREAVATTFPAQLIAAENVDKQN